MTLKEALEGWQTLMEMLPDDLPMDEWQRLAVVEQAASQKETR